MKKTGGTKWKKWQHGFLCSQYYLGYFKCILQDYSKKYYNISFPYINRWTNAFLPYPQTNHFIPIGQPFILYMVLHDINVIFANMKWKAF